MTASPLLVIAGPTATGKTTAAMALAEHFNAELVGADSVQVYRGFDVGSAKPTQAELGNIKHHLIDVIDPDQEIDAVAYAGLADRAIEAIHGRDRLPIVVGGTGLWIRALIRGLVDVPQVDPALRKQLEAEAEAQGTEALHSRLAEVDPLTAQGVHHNDKMRIVRALEVYAQTGVPLGKLREAHARGEPRYRTVFVVTGMDREQHAELVTARIQTMLEAGWVEEVRSLRERWNDDVRPFGSVGYRELLAHLRDGVPLDETQRLIRKSTRTYARRQRTWFKGEAGVSWFSESADLVGRDGRERIARELGL